MNNNELWIHKLTDEESISALLGTSIATLSRGSAPVHVAAVMNNSNCSVACRLLRFGQLAPAPARSHMTLQLCPHVPRVTTSVRIMPAFDQSPWLFPNDLIILPQIATYYGAMLIRQFSSENCPGSEANFGADILLRRCRIDSKWQRVINAKWVPRFCVCLKVWPIHWVLSPDPEEIKLCVCLLKQKGAQQWAKQHNSGV